MVVSQGGVLVLLCGMWIMVGRVVVIVGRVLFLKLKKLFIRWFGLLLLLICMVRLFWLKCCGVSMLMVLVGVFSVLMIEWFWLWGSSIRLFVLMCSGLLFVGIIQVEFFLMKWKCDGLVVKWMFQGVFSCVVQMSLLCRWISVSILDSMLLCVVFMLQVFLDLDFGV